MWAHLREGFASYLVVCVLFALGNSSDAFLLVRAHEVGWATRSLPLLWFFHHLVNFAITGGVTYGAYAIAASAGVPLWGIVPIALAVAALTYIVGFKVVGWDGGNFITGGEKIIEMKLLDPTLTRMNQSGLTVKSSFDIKPGTYLVRMVVRDGEGSQMAAKNGAVTIPY